MSAMGCLQNEVYIVVDLRRIQTISIESVMDFRKDTFRHQDTCSHLPLLSLVATLSFQHTHRSIGHGTVAEMSLPCKQDE